MARCRSKGCGRTQRRETEKKRREAAKIRKWIGGLFESGTGNALPRFFEFSYEEFLRYKDDWLLWRNLGRVDGNGAWIAPVSFVEAQQLPDNMLSVFFALDNMVAKMAKQEAKKKR